MNKALKAMIFDMDGVLVDSEPLWRKAMIKGFAEAGIRLSEDDCRKTQGTRVKEVVLYWLNQHKNKTEPEVLENRVLQLLVETIDQDGQSMPRIPELLEFFKSRKIKCGLATSSSQQLMNAVLDKLNFRPFFNVLTSAEHMRFGKPHPQVFLECAEKLDVEPSCCLVLEDSVNGVIAAKAAQMKVIAVPDPDHRHQRQFALADYCFLNFPEAEQKIRELFAE